MALLAVMNRVRFRPSGLGLALTLTLVLGGCAEDDTSGENVSNVDGTPSGSDSAATGGPGTTPGAVGSGGAMGLGGASGAGAGGVLPSTGGATGGSGGAGVPTGSTAGSGGEGASGEAGSGGEGLGTGGTSGQGGSGGEDVGPAGFGGEGGAGPSSPGGTGGSSGEAPVPSGGSSGEASGGAGGASAGFECTRDFLDGIADDYFAALSAGDPSTLPLAADVKFTENAEETEIGTTDFWMNAGDTAYSQRALDTAACSVAAQAVTPEGGTDLPIALRIKVENAEITEVETIVVRPGDYTASFAVASDPDAIIAMADEIGWHDEVPEGERATREELTAWIDTYFRAFPSGVCDVTSACRRLENGGGNFSCGTGASCSGSPSAQGFEPRVIIVDEVRGIAAGLTIFDFMTTGHLDMHMMKMSGGEVHAVHAILRDTGGQSGWD